MALDYGYWSALSTGWKSAQDRKSQRDSEMMKQLQYLQMVEKQEAENLNQKNLIQNQLNTASALTDQLLKNTFGRQKDIDDMKEWHAEHSGWSDIKDIIKQYNGDYKQARLYGNLDYYINKYHQKINNPNSNPLEGNPILLRAQQNKANIEKYILAAGEDKDKARIMPLDRQRFNDFREGKIDDYNFAGLRADYDIQGLIDETDIAEEVDMDDFIMANYSAILTDMSNDTGISIEQLQDPAQMSAVRSWVQQATGFGVDQTYYGTKERDVSYSQLFDQNLEALGPLLIGVATGEDEVPQPMTLNRLLELENKGISFQNIIESRDKDGKAYSDVWEQLGGYNSGKTPYNKLGGINTFLNEGSQLISSGQILTDPALQLGVMKSMYGDKFSSTNNKVYDINMNGLYDEYGVPINEDDIANTWDRILHGAATGAGGGAAGGFFIGGVGAGPGAIIGGAGGAVAGLFGWNPYAENETEDLEYHGTYLALQMEMITAEGKKESALITYRTSESKLKKMKEQFGNRELKVVMVNELREPDMVSDDVYYDVVPMNDATFRVNMDKNTDSETLSKVYNESLSYEMKMKNETEDLKRKTVLNQNLADIYTDGNVEILPEVANTYKQSVGTSLVVGGLTPDKADISSPMIMSWLLTESEKLSGGDKQKQNVLMQEMTKNLSTNLQSPQYKPMLEALKEGPKQFLNWYSKNTDKETFNQFKIKNKDWSKYFRLNK